MVASSAPLDQFVVRNPSYFFDASPERALIDPDNLHILVDHVKCAAFELPFTTERGVRPVRRAGGARRPAGSGAGAPRGRARTPTGQWNWTNESYPADAVSLRSVSSDNFVIVDTTSETRVIGETDFTSGPSTLHPKAIYIVEGQLFQVERLDFEGRKAFVREIDCDYYTTAITYTKVTIHRHVRRRRARSRSHGEVHVVSRVVGFKKIKFYTNENVGSGELDLPEQQMHTTSYWLTIPPAVMAALPYAADDRRDGVVGLAFAHEAGRAAAADVRRPRHRHLDRQRGDRRRTGAATSPQHDLRLRQLSGRHRLQRAAVRDARRAARGDAPADRRVRVRERLPRLRRSDRQHRAARQGRGAADPRSARRRVGGPGLQRHEGRCRTRRPATRRSCRFERARRSHPRDRGAGSVGSDKDPTHTRPMPGALLDRRRRRRHRGACSAASGATALLRRRAAMGAGRRCTGASGSARWPSGSSDAAGEAPLFAGGAPARPPFVFFDLETTGLSGGAGTLAFLVGCGWFERRRRVRDAAVPAGAPRGRAAAARRRWPRELARAGALVSFNGKSFDAPLLESALSVSSARRGAAASCRTSTCCIRRGGSGSRATR